MIQVEQASGLVPNFFTLESFTTLTSMSVKVLREQNVNKDPQQKTFWRSTRIDLQTSYQISSSIKREKKSPDKIACQNYLLMLGEASSSELISVGISVSRK